MNYIIVYNLQCNFTIIHIFWNCFISCIFTLLWFYVTELFVYCGCKSPAGDKSLKLAINCHQFHIFILELWWFNMWNLLNTKTQKRRFISTFVVNIINVSRCGSTHRHTAAKPHGKSGATDIRSLQTKYHWMSWSLKVRLLVC